MRYTKWLIDNFCPKEIFDDIADRPDPSTAKVTMARIVAFDAFRSAIPHLDIILTPNGFGIVNNSNIAPASKERVERLINSLLDNLDNEIESRSMASIVTFFLAFVPFEKCSLRMHSRMKSIKLSDLEYYFKALFFSFSDGS